MVKQYVPAYGDIISVEFNPQRGHEQAGRRPALVVSATKYNQKAGLALCCPITNQEKGYPFEVALPAHCKTTGVILVDQIRSLDWQARQAKYIERAPSTEFFAALEKLRVLIEVD